MITLIETDYENETFYKREIKADCVGTNKNQFVLLGQPTNQEIVDYANNNLAAPDSGDFNNWEIK